MSYMNSEEIVRENFDRLRGKIRQITDREVTIVAVTKMQPDSVFEICKNLGIVNIGENRIQELCQKNELHPEARSKFRIHLIGSLQTNKVKFLGKNVDSLDTLASQETLAKINERWDQNKPLSVLFQINCSGEIQKAGLHYDDPKSIYQLAKLCSESNKVRLEGLMTMGPTPSGSYDVGNQVYMQDTKAAFTRLAQLREEMQNKLGIHMPRLSMGMTHDYEMAIECGATEIRIGSLLFGER